MTNNKIRITQHSGKGNSQHNDRNNLKRSIEEGREIYDTHIDQERIKDNVHIIWDAEQNCYKKFNGMPNKPLHEYEKAFYEKQYGEGLQRTNENYIKNRHPERCKTVEDMLKQYDGKTFNGKPRPNPLAPEEIIIQIGNSHDEIDPGLINKCLSMYCGELFNLEKEHSENIHILDISLHRDESVPHLHIRRVIDYKDEQGLYRVGQAKGLEQAGIELPEPSKPRSRFNNRKMTLDKMMRDKFIEICKEQGLNIEEIPEKGKKHNRTKEEVIAESLDRQAEQAKEIEDLQDKEIDTLNNGIDELNNMPIEVLMAADDLLKLPEGAYAAIANYTIHSRENTWGGHITSLREDIVRNVELYQNGYLTDRDFIPKDKERKHEREYDDDLEL